MEVSVSANSLIDLSVSLSFEKRVHSTLLLCSFHHCHVQSRVQTNDVSSESDFYALIVRMRAFDWSVTESFQFSFLLQWSRSNQ